MLERGFGNLLEAEVEAYVNPVNCVGVMGKGLALQFKQKYPEMFKSYRKAAKAGEIEIGKMHVFELVESKLPRLIINFPTKKHWKAPSELEFIDLGLANLIRTIREYGLQSLAIPALGAGNGRLNWEDVFPRIEEVMKTVPDVRIIVFHPNNSSSQPIPQYANKAPKKLTKARALFLKIAGEYCKLEEELSMLEFQKLAYFLQESGEPLKLRFEKHHYGPYAHNLNHVLLDMNGDYLQGVIDNKPDTSVTLLPESLEKAEDFLKDNPDTSTIERVRNLMYGFESPYGMELLATVHWVASKSPLACQDVEVCKREVFAWSERKRSLLQPKHIEVAWNHLRNQGWLPSSTETHSHLRFPKTFGFYQVINLICRENIYIGKRNP
jgi:O-acetyl-ADP-ribose deacetylase (regulator of RNase III)